MVKIQSNSCRNVDVVSREDGREALRDSRSCSSRGMQPSPCDEVLAVWAEKIQERLWKLFVVMAVKEMPLW